MMTLFPYIIRICTRRYVCITQTERKVRPLIFESTAVSAEKMQVRSPIYECVKVCWNGKSGMRDPTLQLRISMVSSICSSFCLPGEGIGECEWVLRSRMPLHRTTHNALCLSAGFIQRSIRGYPATRLKPSGENIVSDLASPPATTSPAI